MNRTFVNELKQKVDISALIKNYINIQKSGQGYIAICPFHPDSNPSLHISPSKGIYKCFSCGNGGNAIDFVKNYEKITFAEAVKKVAEFAGYSSESIEKNVYAVDGRSFDPKIKKLYDLNKKANDIYVGLLNSWFNERAVKYLLDRKISKENIVNFSLGFCKLEKVDSSISDFLLESNEFNEQDLSDASLANISQIGKIYDYFSNRITFPISNELGLIQGFSGRSIDVNIEPKYLLPLNNKIYDKSKVLYNINKAYNNNPTRLLLCEGNLDVISFYEAFDYHKTDIDAVALLGSSISDNQINLIKKVNSINTVYLWFDNDEAGKKILNNAGLKLISNKFNVVVVENNLNDTKDINDVLIKYGKDKIINLLENSFTNFILYYYNNLLFSTPNAQKVIVLNKLISIYCLNTEFVDKFDVFNLIKKHHDISESWFEAKIKEVQSKNKFSYKNNYKNNGSYAKNDYHKFNSFVSKNDSNNEERSKCIKAIYHAFGALIFCSLIDCNFADDILYKLNSKIPKILCNNFFEVYKNILCGLSYLSNDLSFEEKMHNYLSTLNESEYKNKIKKIIKYSIKENKVFSSSRDYNKIIDSAIEKLKKEYKQFGLNENRKIRN